MEQNNESHKALRSERLLANELYPAGIKEGDYSGLNPVGPGDRYLCDAPEHVCFLYSLVEALLKEGRQLSGHIHQRIGEEMQARGVTSSEAETQLANSWEGVPVYVRKNLFDAVSSLKWYHVWAHVYMAREHIEVPPEDGVGLRLRDGVVVIVSYTLPKPPNMLDFLNPTGGL